MQQKMSQETLFLTSDLILLFLTVSLNSIRGEIQLRHALTIDTSCSNQRGHDTVIVVCTFMYITYLYIEDLSLMACP